MQYALLLRISLFTAKANKLEDIKQLSGYFALGKREQRGIERGGEGEETFKEAWPMVRESLPIR